MVMDNAELQNKIQSRTEQLTRKEAELTMTEETIMKEQQKNQEMRQRVGIHITNILCIVCILTLTCSYMYNISHIILCYFAI